MYFPLFETQNVNFQDDPEDYHQAPVAVQVVGRRLREEQIIEISEAVSKALHKS